MKTELNESKSPLDDVIKSIEIIENLMLSQSVKKMQENLSDMFEFFFVHHSDLTKEYKTSILTTYKAIKQSLSDMEKLNVQNLLNYSEIKI